MPETQLHRLKHMPKTQVGYLHVVFTTANARPSMQSRPVGQCHGQSVTKYLFTTSESTSDTWSTHLPPPVYWWQQHTPSLQLVIYKALLFWRFPVLNIEKKLSFGPFSLTIKPLYSTIKIPTPPPPPKMSKAECVGDFLHPCQQARNTCTSKNAMPKTEFVLNVQNCNPTCFRKICCTTDLQSALPLTDLMT